jgi:hypothetical protein
VGTVSSVTTSGTGEVEGKQMSLPCTVTGEGVGEGSRKGWPVVSRQEEALGEEREDEEPDN